MMRFELHDSYRYLVAGVIMSQLHELAINICIFIQAQSSTTTTARQWIRPIIARSRCHGWKFTVRQGML